MINVIKPSETELQVSNASNTSDDATANKNEIVTNDDTNNSFAEFQGLGFEKVLNDEKNKKSKQENDKKNDKDKNKDNDKSKKSKDKTESTGWGGAWSNANADGTFS